MSHIRRTLGAAVAIAALAIALSPGIASAKAAEAVHNKVDPAAPIHGKG